MTTTTPVMDATLGDTLTRVTALGADRPAITIDDRTVTFAEFDRRAHRVARALVHAGLHPGDRMAVLSRNQPEYFELLFGAARAGVVLVALNWRLAGPEVRAILDDAEPSLLVCGRDQLGLVPADRRPLVLEDGYEQWLDQADDTPVDHEPQPDDVVLQLYSSGTTGLPKGARLTHANLAFTPRMGREFYGMGPDSVNLVPSPLFHIGGIGYGLTTLGQGGHTILLSDLTPDHLVAVMERHRVTHAFAVPAIVAAILASPAVEKADLSSLQRIAYGGAPMTEVLLRRAIDVLGCGFMAVYGMTETAGTVVSMAPEEHEPHRLRSVGRPLPWLEIRLVDPVTEEQVGVGEVGEILVRSGQNTPGYWHRDEQTVDDEGWLRTGDAAYLDAEGFLYLHDRIKDLIISGGENVYPAEVENALAAHADIADVAVVGVPSQRWGETVKAIVVPREGVTLDPDEVLADVRTRLARYKCPTSIDVVETLPRNAAGKVLKRELRAPFWR
ncbi:long-chain-fatty-acid--CoA ligase [Actinomycetospora sp. NBRC 106378]|uniref:long-chain-fatty-acid--CoA ligase n=1 Tax=Actinomycetospora sp. NBRC 106378 TaxID=3032208 RepID=UPI0024A09CE2|nr:long-chain-fatty-acid--CoA ligase [Actinomycetospora sp. NBRC 106378]GLZ55326.1 acyl-CoA synthetase [Actinomycetospora sp. NBRC 106378]